MNEQLDVIGKRDERIESEITIAQSVLNLPGSQKDTKENVATLENAVNRNISDMAENAGKYKRLD